MINQDERDLRIDILRGIALLGIIFVNVNLMNSPAWMHNLGFAFQESVWDVATGNFIYDLMAKKTYPIFTFLFGYSASLFLNKLMHREDFFRHWYQRCVALLIFGVLDVILVWWGDIIVNYALIGALLPFFFKVNNRDLPRLLVVMLITLFIISFTVAFNSSPTTNSVDYQMYVANLSFAEMTKQRIHDFYIFNYWGYTQLFQNPYWFFVYLSYHFQVLFLMVLGMVCHRLDFFNISRNHAFLVLVLCLSYVLFESVPNDYFQAGMKHISILLIPSAFVIVCMQAMQQDKVLKGLSFLGVLGKMSLTVYLVSGFVFSLLLYGYGLGLYGKIGPAEVTSMAIGFIIVIISFCYHWLSRFPLGPLEIILRKVTLIAEDEEGSK